MKYLLTLCMGFFMLLSCNNKSSQSAAIATDEPEVNEDTLFRVIDLANNLKPCSDSLLLSDIVEDVEYVKLEAADNALVGEMYKGYVSDSAIFFSCIGSPIRPHIFMFDRFTGKFIRTIGKSGQGPGEMYSPVNVVAKDSLVYLSSDYRDELFVYKIKKLKKAIDKIIIMDYNTKHQLNNNKMALMRRVSSGRLTRESLYAERG